MFFILPYFYSRKMVSTWRRGRLDAPQSVDIQMQCALYKAMDTSIQTKFLKL
jgi:hypothetical protein